MKDHNISSPFNSWLCNFEVRQVYSCRVENRNRYADILLNVSVCIDCLSITGSMSK